MSASTRGSQYEPIRDGAVLPAGSRPAVSPNGRENRVARTSALESVTNGSNGSNRSSGGARHVEASSRNRGPRVLEVDLVTSLDDAPPSAIEAARFLLASLQHQDESGNLPSRLGFTSALAGEGVTSISRTVAAVLAHDLRASVCLIELNWDTAPTSGSRRRRRRNGAEPEAPLGLADVLRREESLRDVIASTDDPNLTVVHAGAATLAESQVFVRSERLVQVIDVLERRNEHLVFDLPPVLASAATVPLARLAGTIGIVVRSGVTTETQVKAALERLGRLPSAGVVLNRAGSKIPRPIARRLANW
jgi:Mrp family chromosome partitioning ATPase